MSELTGFAPVPRQRLADTLVNRIGGMIQTGALGVGDRLPAIAVMARAFHVGPPTLRQALSKLEAMGLIDIRHGSGVYVTRRPT